MPDNLFSLPEPISIPVEGELSTYPVGRIYLNVNGETRRDATLEELIWKIDEVICHLSGYYHLRPGDLILTGTPAGVGPVLAGDALEGGIDGLQPTSLSLI